MDWQRYAAQFDSAAPRPFLTDVLGADGRRSASAASVPVLAGDLCKLFADAPPPRRRSTVARFVNDRALRILGMASGRSIDPSVPLGELGLDSLLAVELRNTLSAAVGQSLPATLLFDYPTIDSMTDFFINDILLLAEADRLLPVDAETIGGFDLVGSVEGLSDDEVDQLLAARSWNDV
jgi:acyl carrier protein